MDLLDDDGPAAAPGNAHDFTVSELSGAVKRVIEGEFGRVRVRGEVGRVSRPASGHLYFDLKDDRAVIGAVSWKGQVAKMQVRPEEGMEVIATGRMTTFPGQSKYQLVIDDVEPAGEGALMAMLERRRKALAAEGLFEAARKRPLPFLPEVIGVVTSPSGAVIRDILHRLRDRFPRRVLIWPVAVQGQACAPEVAAAIRGFNALPEGGPIPRPDLLIVARGGGSLEDLWGFNEEIVVRAAAASAIPLISAVGHETDTTLIDFAADRRAPTPTAAAEFAVPVRADLLSFVREAALRMDRASRERLGRRRERLGDLGRALGRPETLTEGPRQRFDTWAERLRPALGRAVERKRARFAETGAQVAPRLLVLRLGHEAARLGDRGARLAPALGRRQERAAERLARAAEGLRLARARALETAREAQAREARRLAEWSARLAPALARRVAEERRAQGEARRRLADLAARLGPAAARPRRLAADRLAASARLLGSLGYHATLERGFAVLRDEDGRLVTGAQMAREAARLEAEFADGRVALRPEPGPAGAAEAPGGAGAAPAPQRAPAPEAGAPETDPPKPAAPKRRAPAARPDDPQGSLF